METGLTKTRIMAELSKSPHGKLAEYLPIGRQAAIDEPEFMAHLVSWNQINGQVRDSKVALPIVSLSVPLFSGELAENSFAHVAMLGPRELLRAYRFALGDARMPGRMNRLVKLVQEYLAAKEAGTRSDWDRMAIQHRHTLKELYSLAHAKPGSDYVNIVLNGKRLDKTRDTLPPSSVFSVVSRLKKMSADEAASEIIGRRIPFLIAQGAMEERMGEPAVLHALITRMSPSDLVTNTKLLEKLGVKNDPALRGAFDEALKRAASSKTNTLKTSRAAEQVGDDTMRERLRGLQEKQIKAAGGPDGNWLVLADRSSSMNHAIETARYVSAALAKFVQGKVWLVFFNTTPTALDVSGFTFDQIGIATKHIMASGATCIGCGLNWALLQKIEVDGIAIVSDGGENHAPEFPDVYRKYSAMAGKDVPVYFYQLGGDPDHLSFSMQANKIEMHTFDLRGGVDYYSIPNLVQTMRSNPYGLVDEVMATKLLTIEQVLNLERKEVHAVAV
jgi:hypothetical protein